MCNIQVSRHTIHAAAVAAAVIEELAAKKGDYYIRGRDIGEALENQGLTSAEVRFACKAAAAFQADRFETNDEPVRLEEIYGGLLGEYFAKG
jgi:hypothetical protein